MSYDLVIKNGTVVTASTTFAADVGIKGERIAAVGQDLSGDRVLDASGKLVTPGAVDIHVHMQMPIGDFVSTDDFFSGTVAAAHGGTTAIVDFVERAPGETMVEAIAARRALADPLVVIDYGLHMTIGPAEIDKLDHSFRITGRPMIQIMGRASRRHPASLSRWAGLPRCGASILRYAMIWDGGRLRSGYIP